MSKTFQNISILAPAGQENRDKHGYLALYGHKMFVFTGFVTTIICDSGHHLFKKKEILLLKESGILQKGTKNVFFEKILPTMLFDSGPR